MTWTAGDASQAWLCGLAGKEGYEYTPPGRSARTIGGSLAIAVQYRYNSLGKGQRES